MTDLNEKFYVYIVTCSDGTFYTGYTNDITKRLSQHNGEGVPGGAKYTHSRRPVVLAHIEEYSTKSEAMKREYEVKQLSREEKKDLIDQTDKKRLQ